MFPYLMPKRWRVLHASCYLSRPQRDYAIPFYKLEVQVVLNEKVHEIRPPKQTNGGFHHLKLWIPTIHN